MTDTPPAHILVVDDDPKIRLLLKRCFEHEGYGVSEAADGREVHDILAQGPVDLITLDLNLGTDDGLVVARDIRAKSTVPIIMVTGKGDMIDRIVGLELGADDYITKPFHIREVLARVRSVIRRSKQNQSAQSSTEDSTKSDIYTFNGWSVDFNLLELHDPDGNLCDLTPAELRLLEVFLKHPQHVLSRDQLMDKLKGQDWSPYDRSIDNQISRIRKKIEKDAKKPILIKTIRGEGYRFTGEVKKG